jgi:hypothetical protein
MRLSLFFEPALGFFPRVNCTPCLIDLISVHGIDASVVVARFLKAIRQAFARHKWEEKLSPESETARQFPRRFQRRPVRQFQRALDDRRHIRREEPPLLLALGVGAQARPPRLRS